MIIEQMLFYTDAMKEIGKTKKAFQKYEYVDQSFWKHETSFEVPCIVFFLKSKEPFKMGFNDFHAPQNESLQQARQVYVQIALID